MEIVPGSEKASEIVTKVTRNYLLEAPLWRKEYDEIEDGYKYLAGEHYSPAKRQWYNTQRRPTRTFNLIFPIFNQVMGDFILNDQKIRVYPKPGGEKEIAAAFEDILDQVNFENDYKAVLARAGLAGLVKMGVLYPRWSDEIQIDGSLVIGEVDEFEVMHDSRAIRDGADDAFYWIRSRMLTKGEILHEWSHHKTKLNEALHDREELGYWGEVSEFMQLNINNPDFLNEMEGKYRVIEYHEVTYKNVDVFTDLDTGQSEIWSLEGKKADIFKKIHPNHKFSKRNYKYKHINTVLPALNFLLDEKPADLQDGKPDLVMYNAYNYGKRAIKNFGIFKNAKDPQDDFNDWRNQLADLINKAADPGHTYRPEELENPRDVELYGRAPGVDFKVRATAKSLEDAIRRNDIPQLPFGPDQMSQEAADFIMKVTGVTSNLMGQSESRQEPASLFAQRVRQAKVALVVIYSNWQRTKRRLYEKGIRLIQENMPDDQYFLINHPGIKDEPKEIIVNQRIGNTVLYDLKQGRYGVIAEDMENNPGAKALRFVQKSEVVERVITLFGGAIVSPMAIVAILDWWLGDSDLGDIDKFINAFAAAIQQQVVQQEDQEQKAEAFSTADAMLNLATQAQQLQNPAQGLPSNGGPGGNGSANK